MSKTDYSILILAAGMGSRLGSLTVDTPKSIIDINGRTMLGQSLLYLNEIVKTNDIKIKDVNICIGFRKEKIIEYVSSLDLDALNIKMIENPLYSILNNNFSVWLSSMYLKGKQFVLINGDILYDKQVLIDVFNSEFENLSVIDSTRPLPEDGMKVLVDNGSNKIRAFSKTFYEGYGCTVGIHKFSAKGSTQFFDKIYEQLQAGINSFHHSAIDNLVKNSDYIQYAMDMNGYKWCEVDDLHDLEIAKEFYNE